MDKLTAQYPGVPSEWWAGKKELIKEVAVEAVDAQPGVTVAASMSLTAASHLPVQPQVLQLMQ
jgi:hypothetical protein